MTVQDELSLQPWPWLSSAIFGELRPVHKARLRPAGDSAAQSSPGLEAPPTRRSDRKSSKHVALALQDLEVWRGGAESTPRSGASTQQIVRDVMSHARSGAAGHRSIAVSFLACQQSGLSQIFPVQVWRTPLMASILGPAPVQLRRVLSQRAGRGEVIFNVTSMLREDSDASPAEAHILGARRTEASNASALWLPIPCLSLSRPLSRLQAESRISMLITMLTAGGRSPWCHGRAGADGACSGNAAEAGESM